MPVAAIFTGFFIIAVPVAILMAVWTVVTLARVLFPERPLIAHPGPALWRDAPAPVNAREIGEALRRRRIGPALPARQPVAGEAPPPDPVAEDLWLRRN